MKTPPGSPWTRRHFLLRQERYRWQADKSKRRCRRKTPCLFRDEKRVAAGGEESVGGPDEIKRRDRVYFWDIAPMHRDAAAGPHAPRFRRRRSSEGRQERASGIRRGANHLRRRRGRLRVQRAPFCSLFSSMLPWRSPSWRTSKANQRCSSSSSPQKPIDQRATSSPGCYHHRIARRSQHARSVCRGSPVKSAARRPARKGRPLTTLRLQDRVQPDPPRTLELPPPQRGLRRHDDSRLPEYRVPLPELWPGHDQDGPLDQDLRPGVSPGRRRKADFHLHAPCAREVSD